MGFFSWVTSDTQESVWNRHTPQGATPCYLLIPPEFGGGFLYEEDYDGYGRFCGQDAYALVAKWNKPEECKDSEGEWKPDEEIRSIGINIACYDEDNASLKYPIKITRHECEYDSVDASNGCPNQGYFDWEEEDDEEDYY